jgi:superfamily II DNA or RNA helicase
MCAALCSAYGAHGVKTLTIVPDQGLITQTKNEYLNCQMDTGEYSGNHKTLDHQHVVSTWQALQHNPKVVELFQLVIVDECHGAKGKVLGEILTKHAFNVPYRFGFTGTLPKDESDVMSVHVAIGQVRYEIPASTLIDEGVLAKPNINVLQLEEDLTAEYQQFCDEYANISKPPTYTQFKDGYFPDFSSEKSYLYRKKDRIAWIAEVIMLKADQTKGNVLCLVDNIPYGRQIAALIPGAIFVNGQDMKKAAKRQEVYNMFENHNNLVVIGTVHVVGTGISIDRIFNLITVDMGKSFIRIIQGIGRSLRKADDKDSVDITDICGDLKYSKKHLKIRTNYYTEAGYPFKKRKVTYSQNNIDNNI